MERKAGKVGKGCSHLVVAKYAAAGGNFSYSDARILARLVQADISVEQEADVEFYADNVLAESESGTFASGALKLTVDGLFDEARRYIEGIPEPVKATYGEIEVNETRYAANAQPPYVAVGLVLMGKSGANVFEPVILQFAVSLYCKRFIKTFFSRNHLPNCRTSAALSFRPGINK